MIHTLELSRLISKDTFELICSQLTWGYYKANFWLTMAYAECGLSAIRLYKISRVKKSKDKPPIDDELMYFYMVAITANPSKMLNASPYRTKSIQTFTPDFVTAIYLRIFEVLPCLEQAQELRETLMQSWLNGGNYDKSAMRMWNELNAFKARRIDFAFDLYSMHEQYLTLINRGYTLRKRSFERSYFEDKELQAELADDEPDFDDDTDSYNPDVDYVYYKGKSVNINIYDKGKQLEKGNMPAPQDEDYNFLRVEVQVKKNKLNALVKKHGLLGRELHYLITPEIEQEVLNSYVKALTGTGVYVTYQTALKIIDNSNFTRSKRERLKKVVKTVSDKHGIAKVLEQVQNGTITDLGQLSTVKSYLREIHDLGINPVTISARMGVAKAKLTSMTGGEDIHENVLPNLLHILESVGELTRACPETE